MAAGAAGRRTTTRAAAKPDDQSDAGSQLSGAESVAQGTDQSSRRTRPATGKGVVEFLVGSKRNNYSTPVYFIIVFMVSVVLLCAMPWLLREFEELSIDERLRKLEARPAGSSGMSSSQLEELQKQFSDMQANLEEIQASKAAMQQKIDAFERQQAILSRANSGDLTGVTKDLANMESKLAEMLKSASKYDSRMSQLQRQMAQTEKQTAAASASQKLLSSSVKANTDGVGHAKDSIAKLEQSLKDSQYAIDGLSSTVERKCSGSFTAQGAPKIESPNFALRHAGATVHSVRKPSSGIVHAIQDTIYRFTGLNFVHSNPEAYMLDSANEPGQCWCFVGQQANVTIGLIQAMVPREFFLHHIYMNYYEETKIDLGTAAPKDFSVFGVGGDGKEYLLGDYRYDALGQKSKGLTQLFSVRENQGMTFQRVKVAFRASTWSTGRKYTCVYQFGVHGVGSLMTDN